VKNKFVLTLCILVYTIWKTLSLCDVAFSG
jgi:hypothetical protein